MQDLDQTETSSEIAKALAATGKFKITNVDPALEAEKYAKDNQANLSWLFPKTMKNPTHNTCGSATGTLL